MKILSFWSNQKTVQALNKVLLVDDHEMILDGISRLIDDTEDYEVVSKCTRVTDALAFLNENIVDIIISDYNMPEDDGMDLVRKVKKAQPDVKIIMLSMHDESHLVKEILQEGIHGYILKKDSQDELLNALNAIAQDKIYLSNDVNTMLVRDLGKPVTPRLLTSREREVLKLIAKEYTNKLIAEELFISERTVETHRKNIFRKTETSSLVGLIKFAYANNLI